MKIENMLFDYKEKLRVMKEVGGYCRIWRHDHGYAQVDIALISGYSTQSISKFELGSSDNYIILFAYVRLGMSITELSKVVNTFG